MFRLDLRAVHILFGFGMCLVSSYLKMHRAWDIYQYGYITKFGVKWGGTYWVIMDRIF